MVIAKLNGGLGNQLFQYASGRALSIRDNVPLRFDTLSFRTNRDRYYGLSHFNIPAELIEPIELNKFLEKSGFLSQIGRITRRFLVRTNPNYMGRIVRERNYHFDPDFFKIKSPVYLIGYWQSERYFHEIREIILQELTLREPLNPINLRVSENIQDSTSISIHVRRGDYISNSQFYRIHGVCSLDYYSRAVEFMVQRARIPHFFVFSDDINWARENLKFPYQTTFVDHNNSNQDYLDLILMSQCHHHIIANSSFSWWGAWLNKREDKVVIAPKHWFNESDRDTRDLLPKSWIRL